ncbi:hypothetical protein H1R17_01570 [Flavobacterium sp. xlx-214]|uniref:ATP synthase F0 subunit B n=1 Tax=unclassified Flavobacterium TaxID=196869 RepID=UPI0013D853CD|nr:MULTISPECIES: ATP synthase F0 subunit B [unclassified Flavobacterium]MBA5792710.1 hypothetical protein [Flavobacterium sp. xlx-221]QMI83854.1 hypothetical protein H1R17_01570 [Flavobacterium sp. xlx-214]
MKTYIHTTIILLFLFLYKHTYSQTVNFYVDASKIGYGYSYNVTLGITEINKGDQIKRFEVKLLKVEPDAKGYLLNGKHYTSSQLGISCNPLKSAHVQVMYTYEDNGTLLTTQAGLLQYIGDSSTIVLGSRATFKELKECFISNLDISDACRKKITEILNPPKNANANNNSSGKKTDAAISTSSGNSNTNSEQKTQTTTTTSSNKPTSDDFWNDSPSQTPQKSKEQIAADKKLQESRDRYAEQENRFFNTMEKQKQEQDRRDAVMANSFYANEARSRAEQGISDNSSFNQRFDNVEDLQNAFYNQANAINQYAQDLSDARMQQNANTQEYLWGNSTGADQAVGELATSVANIIGNAKAEKERKEAQEKLRKERDAERTRIETERKQKIANLRNDIFKQYPEGGVPLSRHNINLDELYFFTYWYDGKTTAKVSNVFPYAKFKDGTWAFKDKVISESEKAAGGKVTLVGYFTTKALAEKERSVFVELLPQAEVSVSTYTVKGKKWDGAENGATDFWGNETKTETKQETKTTTPQKTDDFWGETKTEKKTETKKSDSFWD